MRVTVQGNRLASLGAHISVEISKAPPAALVIHAPFYTRKIPISSISEISAHEDDGMNHGLVNWFVTGRADCPKGVRINNGGSARVEIQTTEGRRYNVVVDGFDQAAQIIQAVQANKS